MLLKFFAPVSIPSNRGVLSDFPIVEILPFTIFLVSIPSNRGVLSDADTEREEVRIFSSLNPLKSGRPVGQVFVSHLKRHYNRLNPLKSGRPVGRKLKIYATLKNMKSLNPLKSGRPVGLSLRTGIGQSAGHVSIPSNRGVLSDRERELGFFYDPNLGSQSPQIGASCRTERSCVAARHSCCVSIPSNRGVLSDPSHGFPMVNGLACLNPLKSGRPVGLKLAMIVLKEIAGLNPLKSGRPVGLQLRQCTLAPAGPVSIPSNRGVLSDGKYGKRWI